MWCGEGRGVIPTPSPRDRSDHTLGEHPSCESWPHTAVVLHSCRVDNSARIPAVIFDVDGTLCDVRQIRHFVERPMGAERFRPNFALFHSASEDCPAFPRVVELVSAVAREGYAIVIVTAREARWAELTERWLNRHGIPRHELIARRELDYRSDDVVKAEMCAEIQVVPLKVV